MTPADGLRVAFRALAANKLRTALTLLGMVIGVFRGDHTHVGRRRSTNLN